MFLFTYLKGRKRWERGEEGLFQREKTLPEGSSLLLCPEQLGIGQTQTQEPWTSPGSVLWGTVHHWEASRAEELGLGPRQRDMAFTCLKWHLNLMQNNILPIHCYQPWEFYTSQRSLVQYIISHWFDKLVK